MPIIPAFRRLQQEDHEFEASWGLASNTQKDLQDHQI
jgi:hypothetical protein